MRRAIASARISGTIWARRPLRRRGKVGRGAVCSRRVRTRINPEQVLRERRRRGGSLVREEKHSELKEEARKLWNPPGMHGFSPRSFCQARGVSVPRRRRPALSAVNMHI